MPLLEVSDLRTQFRTSSGVVRAVDGVSFDVDAGETLGLVGESGCGKSVTALSLMRLVPEPGGRIISGKVVFDGQDLLKASDREMRHIRGNDLAMVFQDPMTSLNPVLPVGRLIAEGLQLHLGMGKRSAHRRAVELLELVGIPSPEKRSREYPHQLSGGMRQRVMIAIALSCKPKLILADEPTTALDVTIQAQILELLRNLASELATALILITHDLGVVAGMAQRIQVMYAGRVVEKATARDLFSDPRMPYTWGLLRSIPRLDEQEKVKLVPIEGAPPDLTALPTGCAFAPRCAYSREICRTREPELLAVSEAHEARCWGVQDVAGGGWLRNDTLSRIGLSRTHVESKSTQGGTDNVVRRV